MYDKGSYKTVSGRVTVWEPEFFIKACLNKPAKLVFGHDNNYLESMRLPLGFIFQHFKQQWEEKQWQHGSQCWGCKRPMDPREDDASASVHTTSYSAGLMSQIYHKQRGEGRGGTLHHGYIHVRVCSVLYVSSSPTAYLPKFPTDQIRWL